jgi:large subunit ribosomal protein L30
MAKKVTKQISVTQIKSSIGCPDDQRQTLAALGLKRMHQTVSKADTPVIRGMVAKVAHLVKVDEETKE